MPGPPSNPTGPSSPPPPPRPVTPPPGKELTAKVHIQGANYIRMCAAAGVYIPTPHRRLTFWASYAVFAALAVAYLVALGT